MNRMRIAVLIALSISCIISVARAQQDQDACDNPLFSAGNFGRYDLKRPNYLGTPQTSSNLGFCTEYNGKPSCCNAETATNIKSFLEFWSQNEEKTLKKGFNYANHLLNNFWNIDLAGHPKSAQLKATIQAEITPVKTKVAELIKAQWGCANHGLKYTAKALCFGCNPLWKQQQQAVLGAARKESAPVANDCLVFVQGYLSLEETLNNLRTRILDILTAEIGEQFPPTQGRSNEDLIFSFMGRQRRKRLLQGGQVLMPWINDGTTQEVKQEGFIGPPEEVRIEDEPLEETVAVFTDNSWFDDKETFEVATMVDTEWFDSEDRFEVKTVVDLDWFDTEDRFEIATKVDTTYFEDEVPTSELLVDDDTFTQFEIISDEELEVTYEVVADVEDVIKWETFTDEAAVNNDKDKTDNKQDNQKDGEEKKDPEDGDDLRPRGIQSRYLKGQEHKTYQSVFDAGHTSTVLYGISEGSSPTLSKLKDELKKSVTENIKLLAENANVKTDPDAFGKDCSFQKQFSKVYISCNVCKDENTPNCKDNLFLMIKNRAFLLQDQTLPVASVMKVGTTSINRRVLFGPEAELEILSLAAYALKNNIGPQIVAQKIERYENNILENFDRFANDDDNANKVFELNNPNVNKLALTLKSTLYMKQKYLNELKHLSNVSSEVAKRTGVDHRIIGGTIKCEGRTCQGCVKKNGADSCVSVDSPHRKNMLTRCIGSKCLFCIDQECKYADFNYQVDPKAAKVQLSHPRCSIKTQRCLPNFIKLPIIYGFASATIRCDNAAQCNQKITDRTMKGPIADLSVLYTKTG